MVPRSRRRAAGAASAAQPAASPACCLADVPAGVLTHILGLLESCRDRQSAALVCRRWHDCVHSGELCSQVVAAASGLNSLAALDSLACWLLRHGRLVRSMRLTAGQLGHQRPEQEMLLGCCLAAAAAPGRLDRLCVGSDSLFVPAAWVRPLLRLRELSLLAREGLCISASLAQHSQLTALRLRGAAVVFQDRARLPASLLRLEFAERFDPDLPSQLSALTRLSMLRLANGNWEPDGYAALKQLPALRHLALHSTLHLPDCLGELTQVRHLVLEDELPAFLRMGPAEQINAQLNASLQQLTQLTSLHLRTHAWQGGLPALASLSRLQRLCLDDGGPPSLPPGQWIAGLRELGAGWGCLCSSREVLAAAAQLEMLVVLERSAAVKLSADRAFFAWAAAHPPLRRLQFSLPRALPVGVSAAVGHLLNRRPEMWARIAEWEEGDDSPDLCPFVASFDLPPIV